ncbi:flagellar hook-length control protein FliK [Nocardioides deserti]|uniref:Flagellar hook-length control protein FliK n=1 Tax=Nocardioides deserti TaxID=1588644 RepID=A0ABR6UE98_9ACTN|nr:flagellar hook-length control protein FliK [Nocardioides deserti]MBC2962418.1 flagellar hook-length control protein FliK [Nocardioides deserti]
MDGRAADDGGPGEQAGFTDVLAGLLATLGASDAGPAADPAGVDGGTPPEAGTDEADRPAGDPALVALQASLVLAPAATIPQTPAAMPPVPAVPAPPTADGEPAAASDPPAEVPDSPALGRAVALTAGPVAGPDVVRSAPAGPTTPAGAAHTDTARPTSVGTERTPVPATAGADGASAAGLAPATGGAVTAAPAPAVGSARAEGAAPAPVSRQLADTVQQLARSGEGTHRMTLRLDPGSLGEVRIHLVVRDGGLQVHLAAGHEALSSLGEGADELLRLLQTSGPADVRVTVRDLAPGQQPGQQTGQQPDQQQGQQPGAAGHDPGDRPDGRPQQDGREPGPISAPPAPTTTLRAGALRNAQHDPTGWTSAGVDLAL